MNRDSGYTVAKRAGVFVPISVAKDAWEAQLSGYWAANNYDSWFGCLSSVTGECAETGSITLWPVAGGDARKMGEYQAAELKSQFFGVLRLKDRPADVKAVFAVTQPCGR